MILPRLTDVWRTRRGLSLLEVLVGLSVTLIVAGTGVVQYRTMLSGWQLNAAARQVVMDLKLTRTRAMSTEADHRLRFADGAFSYQRQRKLPSGSYANDGPAIALPDGIAVADCTAVGSSVTFRPRGQASTFGTITLANANGAQRRIVVDIVGRMRVP